MGGLLNEDIERGGYLRTQPFVSIFAAAAAADEGALGATQATSARDLTGKLGDSVSWASWGGVLFGRFYAPGRTSWHRTASKAGDSAEWQRRALPTLSPFPRWASTE